MLLSIQDLKVAFRMGRGVRAEAVKGVSFDIPENTTVALVGESGSGKSVTAMSVLNLLPDNAERQGRIVWQGRDLLQASLPELQALRGKEIACVFQDPMSSLNPVFNIGQHELLFAVRSPQFQLRENVSPRLRSFDAGAGEVAHQTGTRGKYLITGVGATLSVGVVIVTVCMVVPVLPHSSRAVKVTGNSPAAV